MVQFWLDNVSFLISPDNFNFNGVSPSQKNIKLLNIIALTSLIVGLVFVYIKRDPKYFAMGIAGMGLTILIKSNIKVTSPFTNVMDSAFESGAKLMKSINKNDPSGLNNIIYVDQGFNFNKGDIIGLANNNKIVETNVIADVRYTTQDQLTVLVLLNPLKYNYSKYTTKILTVSNSVPDIIPPPDGNLSIQKSSNYNPDGSPGTTDPMQMSLQNYPKFGLPNQNRNDWNLQQSSMVPGGGDNYVYQGQPYGDLKCRNSTVENPMATINVTEYDAPPTMYGTCNVAEQTDGVYNDNLMTSNQEATVSQRVDDLLFHKGNAQSRFSPMPVDTLPDNQEAFANFCYNQPTNMINVKYGSIFVNDPAKMKLVTSLTKATGNEGGSGNR